MNPSCLNCNTPVYDKFCARCGQKTDTHRITLRHFIFHDLLHGVWHIDKGIPFTLKQAIFRPGKAALDYINGKRQPFYNVFYLSLALIALTLLLNGFIDSVVPDTRDPDESPEQYRNRLETGMQLQKYVKLLVFAIVPVFALNAKLLFRRAKLNFAEHSIIAGICLLGILTINLFYLVFFLLNGMYGYVLFDVLEKITVIAIILFPAYVYAGAVKNRFSLAGFTWRMTLFYILFMIQGIVVTRYIYFVITGKISVFGHTF